MHYQMCVCDSTAVPDGMCTWVVRKYATCSTPCISTYTIYAPHSCTPLTGMNLFLKNLNITFRRDPTNYRPRINKLDSTKDREQKVAGTFYYLED